MTRKAWHFNIAEFFKKEQAKLVYYVKNRIEDASDRDAEDVVQDVMVNLFDRTDITLPIRDLSSYIYQSLRNRIIDLFRKKREDLSLDHPITANGELTLKNILHDVRYDIVTDMEKKELAAQLYSAVDSLNDREKAVVIATELEGCSFRELSEEWDVPVGTLLARKSRAFSKLRKRLKIDRSIIGGAL